MIVFILYFINSFYVLSTLLVNCFFVNICEPGTAYHVWLQSVASNYSELSFFRTCLQKNPGDVDGKVNGLLQHLSTFFSLKLNLFFFPACRNGCCTAKQPAVFAESFPGHWNAPQIHHASSLKINLRIFWKNTVAAAYFLNMEGQFLGRPRKNPRGKDGCAPSHSFQSAEAMYRQQCYKVMDTATTSLDCRLSKFAFKHF